MNVQPALRSTKLEVVADHSQVVVTLTIIMTGIRICQGAWEEGPDPVCHWQVWASACFISCPGYFHIHPPMVGEACSA